MPLADVLLWGGFNKRLSLSDAWKAHLRASRTAEVEGSVLEKKHVVRRTRKEDQSRKNLSPGGATLLVPFWVREDVPGKAELLQLLQLPFAPTRTHNRTGEYLQFQNVMQMRCAQARNASQRLEAVAL